jgi:hypothetical protein
MRALSASELLSVWESGCNQRPLQRALTMLAAAGPEDSFDSLARLTIGQRDACLLKLRELTFGSELTGVTDCPECAEKIELSLNCSDFRPAIETEPPAELVAESNGRELRFRLPTSEDLLAVNTPGELLQRCLLNGGADPSSCAFGEVSGIGFGEADPPVQRVRLECLTENFIAAVGEKMSSADPMADIHLALECPSCEHNWEAPFDIVAFLWREISAAAHRLLREVHTLASAYGWTETEILRLSPARRRMYLEMATG